MERYRILKQIGRGNFGVVHLAESVEDKKLYVVKQIDMVCAYLVALVSLLQVCFCSLPQSQMSLPEREGSLQEVRDCVSRLMFTFVRCRSSCCRS
jgi:hypothetical protein